MHVDGIERHLAGEVRGHHHHPRDPEKDDVEAGDQHRRWQEHLVVRRFFRPAQCRERHQCRREPGIKHIGIAPQRLARRLRLRFGFGAGDIDGAVLVIPGRNLMTPPQLTRNTPVLDIVEPLVISAGPVLGNHLHFAAGDFFQCDFGDRFAREVRAFRRRLRHRHKPLVGQHRLDHDTGTVAARHHQFVRLDAIEQPKRIEIGNDFLARHEAVHALIFGRTVFVDLRIQREDIDHRQLMALADCVVVVVMRRRDLHATGTEFLVNIAVGDDRDLAAAQRQRQHLADQVGIAHIGRIDRHGGIAQQGFGTRRGHRQVPAAIGQRIADMPHETFFFLRHHFQIRHRRAQHRIPMHQSLAAIDQALLEQPHEYFGDGARELRIHREIFAAPVGRGTHPAHLTGDGRTGLFFPLPDFLDEFFTAKVMA
ncbi:hypothetical protein IMCC9480_1430 [Oxalobacteraceae bacterium IMCC9480]|nr:hypothetical protein IMCC9480_1430 [Oxalobacteraceae bacterium IMCC9480]